MSTIRRSQNGFGLVETVLVIAFVTAVGLLSWYVLHAKHAADNNLAGSSQSAASKGGGKTSGGTDDKSLQGDLDSLEGTNNQGNKDLSSASSGLDDSSTFTSLPQ
jgi:hypothetical protein